jgi:hypothetical protein
MDVSFIFSPSPFLFFLKRYHISTQTATAAAEPFKKSGRKAKGV